MGFKSGEKDEWVIAHWDHHGNSSHNHMIAIALNGTDESVLFWVMVGLISAVVVVVLYFLRQRCSRNGENGFFAEDRLPISKVVESRSSGSGFRIYQTDKYGSNDRHEDEERVNLISGPIEIENGHSSTGRNLVVEQGQKARSKSSSSSRSSFSSASGRKTAVTYFSAHHLKDGNDTSLNHAFASVMSAGLVLSLHTSNGPRPINMSMIGDEVRWQAAKQPNGSKVKRYKLNLLDVMFVDVGKQSGHFQDVEAATKRSPQPTRNSDDGEVDADSLCFALVTQKTSLYLEAATKVDRDCLVRGFQLRLEGLRS